MAAFATPAGLPHHGSRNSAGCTSRRLICPQPRVTDLWSPAAVPHTGHSGRSAWPTASMAPPPPHSAAEVASTSNGGDGGHRSPVPTATVDVGCLLGAATDAVARACTVIRSVQAGRGAAAGDTAGLGVRYKETGDPRSALTVADIAAQRVMLGPLRAAFPGIPIVAEEDEDGDGAPDGLTAAAVTAAAVVGNEALRAETPAGLVTPPDLAAVPLASVCLFIDPVDGTGEFVAGRLSSVQCLLGISVDGRAVAGVIGLPFHDDARIIAALVGSGVVGLPAATSLPSEADGLVLTGSAAPTDPVLLAVTSLVNAATVMPLGGAGAKLLAVASGAAHVAVLNLASSVWDTAAHDALLRCVGGTLTDLFGCQLVHRRGGRVSHRYGLLATGPAYAAVSRRDGGHAALTRAIRAAGVADPLLHHAGVVTVPSPPAVGGGDNGGGHAADVARDLDGEPLTAAWLSTVIAGAPGRIVAYAAPEATAVRYLMSDAVRLMLMPSDGVHAGSLPTSVFFKRVVMADLDHVRLKAASAPFKLARDMRSYAVEAAFLSSAAAEALEQRGGVRLSRPYHIATTAGGRESAGGVREGTAAPAIPAAAAAAAAMAAPLRLTDCRWGLLLADFSPADGWAQAGLLDGPQLKAVLSLLAKVHGFFWVSTVPGGSVSKNGTIDGGNHYGLDGLVWEQGSYWAPGRQSPVTPASLAAAWSSTAARFEAAGESLWAAVPPGIPLKPEAYGEALGGVAAEVAAAVHGGRGTRCLLHGDAKAANFFFRDPPATVRSGGADAVGRSPEVGVIDWQWTGWGNPATDVAYCLATSAAASCLSMDGTAEESWLRHYHTALVAALVAAGAAPDAAAAARMAPLDQLRSAYEAALLDLAVLVISYHWARIRASPAVLAARAGMVGSNSYNKSVWHARWLIARTAGLLSARSATLGGG